MSKRAVYTVKWLLITVTCCTVLFLFSCEKELSCENCQPGDDRSKKPPVANAGPDQTIQLPADSVQLNGSASSDPDGTITTARWTKLTGGNVTITDPAHLISKAKHFTEGIYQFELSLTDDDGLTAKDTMQVVVDDPNQNHPPVARAGDNQTIILPVNSVLLNGSTSSDPDNNITAYQWTNITGPPSFVLASPTSVQTMASNLTEGIYIFQLQVTDATGLYSRDTMEVRVESVMQSACPFLKTFITTNEFFVSDFKTTIAGNKIVIAGGRVNGGLPSKEVHTYDLLGMTWSSYPSTIGNDVALFSNQDLVFIAGGSSSSPPYSTSQNFHIYNSGTNTNNWNTKQLSMPGTGIHGLKAGDKVIFAGGTNGSISSTGVDIFDPSTDALHYKDLGHYISNAASINNIAVFAGSTTGIDIYNTSANSWSTSMHNMDQYEMTLATSGTRFVFAGGFHAMNLGYGYSDRVHIYDHSTGNWSQTTMTKPRAGAQSIGTDNKIFWFGGYDSIWLQGTIQHKRPVNDIEIYDVNTGTRSHHTWTGNPNHSGRTNNYVFFYDQASNLHLYNLLTEQWSICYIDLGPAPLFLWKGNTAYVVSKNAGSLPSVSIWKLDL